MLETVRLCYFGGPELFSVIEFFLAIFLQMDSPNSFVNPSYLEFYGDAVISEKRGSFSLSYPNMNTGIAGRQVKEEQTLDEVPTLSISMPSYPMVPGAVSSVSDLASDRNVEHRHNNTPRNHGDEDVHYNYEDDMENQYFYDDHLVEEVVSVAVMSPRGDLTPQVSTQQKLAPCIPSLDLKLCPPNPRSHPLQSEVSGRHYSLNQLQVLYNAKCHLIDNLTRQLVLQKEDSDRHVRILRENKAMERVRGWDRGGWFKTLCVCGIQK